MGTEVAQIDPPRLPYHPGIQERFNLGVGEWKALTDAIFPSAKSTNSVIIALNYCKARGLDPFKKPVAIVPVWDSKAKRNVETVWPGIGELRTTAHRTGNYAGMDAPVFGPLITSTFTGKIKQNGGWVKAEKTVTYPEFVTFTVYRMVAGVRCPYVATVFWIETYGTQGGSDIPNRMWEDRPRGQLLKCGEAAALRMAFPEEIGNEYSAEEMEGRKVENVADSQRVIDATAVPSAPGGDSGKEAPDHEEVVQLEAEAESVPKGDEAGEKPTASPEGEIPDASEYLEDEGTAFDDFVSELDIARTPRAIAAVWRRFEEHANASMNYDDWLAEYSNQLSRVKANA